VLVRDALDLRCRVAERLVSQVGQGARGSDLLPDLRDLLVIGVAAGQPVANQANGFPGQSGLGPRLPARLEELDSTGQPSIAVMAAHLLRLLVPLPCGWR
jgi:hypothetical protein